MRDAPPPFTLRQLQYLVAVADLKSFRRAAERCRVAQPSLSAQIAELEDALGVLLFERDKRSVRVTTAGEAVVMRARAVLAASGELLEDARRVSNPLKSTLRIGVIPTVAPYQLPQASPALRRAFPELTILWAEHTTALLVKRVLHGDLDGGVVAAESEVSALTLAPFASDPFMFACATAHPLARDTDPLELTTLAGERMLLLEEGHCLHDQVRGFCTRVMPDELAFRATSLATLVQMVAAGAGVTLLPRLAVKTESRAATLTLRPLAEAAIARTLAVAWRPGSAVAGAMGALGRTLAPLFK